MIVSFSEYQRISDKSVPEFQNDYFTLTFQKKAINDEVITAYYGTNCPGFLQESASSAITAS